MQHLNEEYQSAFELGAALQKNLRDRLGADSTVHAIGNFGFPLDPDKTSKFRLRLRGAYFFISRAFVESMGLEKAVDFICSSPLVPSLTHN